MNEKIENLLNIAFDVNDTQRMKNDQLSAGYEDADQTWEFVIKYSGDKEELQRAYERPFVFLYHQFAISRGTQTEIERLASNPQVEWIEKPKTMKYAVAEGIRESCIRPLALSNGELTGKGVLISIIDSGIDIYHPDFIRGDGTTRIVGIWDQSGTGTPPEGYFGGAFYGKERINEAIKTGRKDGFEMLPFTDLSGHGTHVAGIAAGNGRASGGRLKGVAYEAELLVVKLGTPENSDFPRTTQVMTGIDFSVRYALANNYPLMINLSFGNNYGDHEGGTLLENYMNQIAGMGQITIVTGMGNQGLGENHTSGTLKPGNETEVSLIVGPGEHSFGLQIWKNYEDTVEIFLIHPSGTILGPFKNGSGLTEKEYGNTEVIFYYGEPVPYNGNQELYITFLPKENRLDDGIWKIILVPKQIKSGFFEMWLPDAGLLSDATKFLNPIPEWTQTIPSTAKKVISVGAYDAYSNRMAPFSGRGRCDRITCKPDLTAPGVNIESCAPGGGYTIKSGTSMAAPFVTGCGALLMEWGIIKNNDPFLYGEKMKAYLRKGAEPIPGFARYPNEITGYGKLCFKNSFP